MAISLFRPPMRVLSTTVRRLYTVQSNANTLNNNPFDKLVDSFGRVHSYLRISLIEKCNLRCQYCMPEHGVQLTEKSKLLTLDERKRLIELFGKLGVNKLRFTGGEPTISTQLPELISFAHSLTINGSKQLNTIAITTNGVVLKEQLDRLVDSGLNSVNISLDTLNPEKFQNITRRDKKLLNRVLSSIYYSIGKNIAVKVNCVLMRGVNDEEVLDFLNFTNQFNVDVRFIELMPFDGNQWQSSNQFVSYYEVLDRLNKQHGVQLVADSLTKRDRSDTTKWFRLSADSPGRVGFITSMSSHFCGGCNRLRLTADGKLKVCLFGKEEFNLLQLMRDGATDEELVHAIRAALLEKKAALGGHGSPKEIADGSNRPMILIGG